MGISMSYIKVVLQGQSFKERCYPLRPYVPLKKDKWPAGPNGLLTEFHVLPEKLHRAVDDSTWFWWCDAQFMPFNDAEVFASAGAFQPRPMRHWISVPHMPNGRILLYNIADPNSIQCQTYTRTSSTVFPKVQPHPLSQLVCYCGTGEVAIMASNGDPLYSRPRDLSNAVHVYCAVAANGISFACLKRGANAFFLETFCLQSSIMPTDFIRCHTLCPGFIPSRTRNDHVALKFSPDCKHIAVSSGVGYLFIITRSSMQLFSIVCPDLTEEALSSAEAFDYHPRYPFEMITCGIINKFIQIIDTANSTIVNSVETEEVIDCIKYTPDGLSLGVGFHNFDIKIFDSMDLSCLHTITMSELCLDQVRRVSNDYPAVLNLSFSQNGEHLISTSCDGRLRLWRIPKTFTLQDLCRDKILSCTPVLSVKNLNLPEKVKKYLMYNYIS